MESGSGNGSREGEGTSREDGGSEEVEEGRRREEGELGVPRYTFTLAGEGAGGKRGTFGGGESVE